MAKMKISNEQFEQLKVMVSKGVTPEEISKKFNIAVSSVHNYKRQLKDAGLKIPDVRGKRPSDVSHSTVVLPITSPVPSSVMSAEGIKITINDTVFYISSKAKSVTVGINELTVTF